MTFEESEWLRRSHRMVREELLALDGILEQMMERGGLGSQGYAYARGCEAILDSARRTLFEIDSDAAMKARHALLAKRRKPRRKK